MIGIRFEMFRPSKEYRELAVLREINRSSVVSQRGLARAAGVSATMINAYVDDLVGRGLLDVTGDTNRSYRYHLTDAGRAREVELAQKLQQELFQIHAALRHELLGVPVEGTPPAQAQSA